MGNLKFLDGNETVRSKYLAWKNTFRVTKTANELLRKICRLCEALNAPSTKWPVKTYSHIDDWWHGTLGNRYCKNSVSEIQQNFSTLSESQEYNETFNAISFFLVFMFVLFIVAAIIMTHI